MKTWFVYILECSDGTYYTGIARDINKRIEEHNASNKLGSKYARARRPVKLIYQEKYSSRSAATKRELEIKKMERKFKEKLIKKTAE